MTEKQYNLICMAFDGEFVKDSSGTLEQCQNASADMGSKWYFYPFHFIVTVPGGIVADTGSGLIDMFSKESFQSKLFKGRKLTTVKKVFYQTYKTAESRDLQLDCMEFERFMIAYNQNLLR
jgi:hypothetical protein